MKPLLTLCACLLSLGLLAQDYSWLGTPSQRFYLRDNEKLLEMYPTFDTLVANDSVYVLAGPPNNPIIHPDCTLPSWVGTHWVLKADWDLFVREDDDTVYVYRSGGISDTWIFYTDSLGNYAEATVTSITYMDVWDGQDSVKNITLQWKDSQGNNLSHPMNNDTILLSKVHGLIRAFDFNLFPGQLLPIQQFDPYRPAFQNIEMGDMEVHNYEVGDEIHTLYSEGYGPTFTKTRTIREIIDKEVYQDSVVYTISRCSRRVTGTLPDDSTIITNTDTILLIYPSVADPRDFSSAVFSEPQSLNFFAGDSIYTFSTGACTGISTLDSSATKYNGRKVRTHNGGWLQYDPGDACFNEIVVGDLYIDSWYYIEGAGGPYYSSGGGGISYQAFSPVYFKKGNEEWGTPFQCNLLLSTPELAELDMEVNVYPNPASNVLNIELPQYQQPLQVKVYDIAGREILNTSLQSDFEKLDVSALAPGKYLLTISDGTQVVAGDSFLKF